VIHKAASLKNQTIIRLLVDQGPDIDAIDKSGNTALMIAASQGHEANLALLIKHEANIEFI